jgi:glycosyltransferase involved in cell wall biosynthesis
MPERHSGTGGQAVKIAFDARAAQGNARGMGVYAINLLRAMSRIADRPEITLLLDRNRPDPQGLNLSAFGITRLSPVGGTIGWEQMVLGGLTGFDLLHCPANGAPIFARTPVLVTIHDAIFMRRATDISDVPYLSQTIGHLYRTTAYPRAARNAKRIITVSEASKSEITSKMVVSADRVTVTHEAVSEIFAEATPTPEGDLLPRLGLARPYCLAMGAYEKRKNLGLLFQVWERLKQAGGTVPCLALCGAENLRATRYTEEVNQRGLAELVRLLPFLPERDLKGLHAYAEAFLMPSRAEGFGLPILEAMSVGTPVIASSIPAHREVAGDAAVLLDPDDVDGWATALRSPDRLAAGRSSGPARSALFTWGRCAGQTLTVYSSQQVTST